MRKFVLILAFLFLLVGIVSCTGTQKIKVSFEENGGAEVEDLEFSINSTSVNLPTPTREGFTFDGWFLDANLSEPFTIAALLTQTGGITLYAKWTENVTTYTITFESNGGSAVSAITQAAGTTVLQPEAPTKSGFTFVGWFSNEALTIAYTFQTMPEENITLYAKWQEIVTNQTITFMANGGSNVAPITQQVGSSVVAPNAPTKIGHTFVGWFSDSGLTKAYTFTTMPSNPLTLYAKWTINNYTINFISNEGSAVETIDQAYNSTVTAPLNPSKVGYTFVGWYSDSGLTEAYTFTTMPAENITLYAKWTINSYTISFNSNGGDQVTDITKTFGSSVTTPLTPSKVGYTFAGWFSDSELTEAYTFTTMPAENITLYAKWTINSYTISFNSNGGDQVTAITQIFGSSVTAPANPANDGYTFNGWYSDVNLNTLYVFTTMPAENITLYAKWTINSYTISFNSNDGDQVTAITQIFGSSVTTPLTPSKVGYTFAGWFSDSELTEAYTFTTMPAENITLYAKWTINSYTISFNSNGGDQVTAITQIFGSSVTAPANPANDGYTFNGWYSDVNLNTLYVFTTMPAENITLYAKWTINSYTISFNSNDGDQVTAITQIFGSSVTTPLTPSKVGYTFAGWFSDSELTEAYTFTTMPAENITLYAKWTINSYTISFNSNGGDQVTAITQIFGSSVTAPANPANDGYTFNGWYSDVNLNTLYVFTTMPAENITLYAKWDLVTYTITFMNAEGIEPIVSAANLEITLPTPTKEGYEFHGWFTDEYVIESFTLTTMPEENITLYAKWLPAKYLIHYVTYSDTVIDDMWGIYQFEIPTPNDYPVKVGYQFIGWYFDEELTLMLDNQTMPAHEVTLYAKWIEVNSLWSIEDIIAYEPYQVKVQATIVYRHMEPHLGFYVADETGVIFVEGTTSYTVGQVIEFNADFNFHEYVPQLSSPTNIVLLTEEVPQTLTHIETPMINLVSMNPEDSSVMGKPVIISGILTQEGPHYFLNEPGSGERVAINYQSVHPTSNPFAGFTGQLMSIHAIVFGFDPMMEIWHVVYDPIEPTEIIQKTDQEKVDELLDFASLMLDQQVFTSHSQLDLPTSETLYGASLIFATSGDNASYFNVTTGTFEETTTERVITLRLTVTINDKTGFVDLSLILKPIEVITITEFLSLDNESYGVVEGIVVLSIDSMGLMIIADETGAILPISSYYLAALGTRIQVQGYHVEMMGLPIMQGTDNAVISELETGIANPLEAISITPEQFMTMDPMLSIYWGKYFEMTGMLTWNSNKHVFFLGENETIVPVVVLDFDDYEKLMMFDGLEVGIKGYILPNFDEGEPVLMFIYTGGEDDIVLNYTDQELLDVFGAKLKEYVESQVYMPGDVLFLPADHPLFSITVSYEVDPLDASLVSTEWVIDSSITAEEWIRVSAKLSLNNDEKVVSIDIHVVPIVVMDIADFIQVTDSDNHYIKGVIMFIHHEELMMIVADDTGIIMVNMDGSTVNEGDLVLLYGEKMVVEGNIILANHLDDILVSVISKGQPIPLIPDVYTVDELMDSISSEPFSDLTYVQILGTLVKQGTDAIYYITDNTGTNLFVLTMEFEDLSVFDSYVGLEVRLTGILMYVNEIDQPVLVFLNSGQDIGPMFDDIQLADYLKHQLETMFVNEVYRPGAYIELPTSYGSYDIDITYQVLEPNQSLYNLSTGYVLDTLTVPATILLTATIQVGHEMRTAEFSFVVEPIELSSISEFLAGAENEMFSVKGIVVLEPFEDSPLILADETGYMFIACPLDVKVGDEIIVTGIVTLQMGIKLMWDYETTVLEDVLSHGNDSPLLPTPLTITQMNNLDMSDPSTWGLYIETTGVVSYEEYSFFPLVCLESDMGQFVAYVPVYLLNSSYLNQDDLFMYVGLRVNVKGFILPMFEDEGSSGLDRLFMIASSNDLVLDYETDQEKIDALIAMGETHLEGTSFRPGDELHLPEEMIALNATLEWSFIGDVSLVYDQINMIFLDVTEPTVIQVEVIISIGLLEQTVIYDITVAPYPTIMIEDFYGLQAGEFGKLEVIVARELDYNSYVLQEPMSMLYLHAIDYENLIVGDRIVIFGQKSETDGFISISGWDDRAYVEVISSGVPDPWIVYQGLLDDLATRNTNVMNLMYYNEVKGHLYYNSFSDDFYVTDGVHTIGLFVENETVYYLLDEYVGQNVKIRFLTYEYWWTYEGQMWTGYVLDEPNNVESVVFTDEETTQFMQFYIEEVLSLKYKDGLSYLLPTTNPYFGGTYQYVVDELDGLLASISGHEISFTENENEYSVLVHVEISYGTMSINYSYEVVCYPYEAETPSFIPGSAGELPTISGQMPENTFAGLYVYKVERSANTVGGDEMVADLHLPDPYELNAMYYKLQYYDDANAIWIDFEDEYGTVISYYDNFSIMMFESMNLRAVTDTGLISNSIQVEYTSVDTYFSGYMLEMSMWVTGIMTPFVGSGILLDKIFIFDLYTHELIESGYQVQWYRVNPYTFEETAIIGATHHLYETTIDDVGYYLMVEVKGDETTVGGLMRIFAPEEDPETTRIFNEGVMTNLTNQGFDMAFNYVVSIQDIYDFMQIYDSYGNMITIDQVIETSTPNVFHISADLFDVNEFYVNFYNSVMISGTLYEEHIMQSFNGDVFEWGQTLL